MYSENNYKMWLSSQLLFNTGVAWELIKRFGSAKDVWNAGRRELVSVGALSERTLEKLIKSRYRYDMDKEIDKLAKSGAKFYTSEDELFPEQLKSMQDPPLGIYVIGDISCCNNKLVSIVGSRKITDYGATVCHSFSKELAEIGVVIVSGLAMGTDTIAHKAAIEGGGKTVAVMGCGVDVVYPASNNMLYHEIANNGCIISEFPVGTPVTTYNFPLRNRIVACLSEVTVVVEAAVKSGTAITADRAIENNRTVMAVPGNITSKLSGGCNKLIKEGATPALSVDDILYELGVESIDKKAKKSENEIIPLAEEEKIVYDCIGCESIAADELAEKLNMDIKNLSIILTFLEMKGYIRSLSGQKVIRNF